jgi:hypothetical protein
LEAAIRAITWSTVYPLFCDSPLFNESTQALFIKSLYQHIKFISENLQNRRTKVPNNHLFAEATALVVVGTLFPEFKKSAEWQAMGLAIIKEQLPKQIYPDGVSREQSTCYHRFVAELLSLTVILGRKGRLPVNLEFEETLFRMIQYIEAVQAPDHTVPMWGDSDYARALGTNPNKNYWDFRSLLSIGAVLFQKVEWKKAAEYLDEETVWLLGASGISDWDKLDTIIADTQHTTLTKFHDAGQFILHQGQDAAYFRCGDFGLGGQGYCIHSHCDQLSVQLWLSGHPVLIDPGTYQYHSDMRNVFRATAAHNTLEIDGCE